jgi:hypothetical protein
LAIESIPIDVPGIDGKTLVSTTNTFCQPNGLPRLSVSVGLFGLSVIGNDEPK